VTRPTRRVVTGHDASGRAVVLIDGAAPNSKVRKATGLTSTLLWVTDGSPADNSGSADSAEREVGVAPPQRGSIFRVVDFPPEADVGAVDNAAMLREMGIEGGRGGAGHATTHRTRSVDYAVVISGEIDMLLDDSEVHLRAGDVLVQRGTNHAWVNRGKESCRIAFVLIDAEEPLIPDRSSLPSPAAPSARSRAR
jgi:naringenin degradation protein FdeH